MMGKLLRDRFLEHDRDRSCSLDRKREHASLTIPSHLPWQGRAMHTELEVPYNTLPAQGIVGLSSQITSVTFPLNGQSVFELVAEKQYNPSGQDDSEVMQALNRFETLVMDTLAPTNLRAATNLAMQHLLTIGDVLLYMDDNFNFRLYRLDEYIVIRKHEGEWQEIIICEAVNPKYHDKLKEVSAPKDSHRPQSVSHSPNSEWEPLYTHVVKRSDGQVEVYQEFRGTRVGDKTYKVSPYFPLRYNALAGEPYGISLVESNFGDIRALDSLTKALIDGSLLNAEYRWGLNPAGLTELQDILDSVNGDIVPTAPGDMFPLQFQNAAQITATQSAVAHLEQKLGRIFLMNSAVQPTGERVTARQVSLIAQELESMLGGILSMVGRELQDPIIRRTIFLMADKNQIPSEISEQIEKQGGFLKLRIRAGLEILNREAEREKLDAAIERMRNLPPEAMAAFNWTAIARDWWQSLGLEDKGRIKTEEELQMEQQRQQQAALAQQAALSGVQAGVQQQQESNQ
jgi:hypothetical protein